MPKYALNPGVMSPELGIFGSSAKAAQPNMASAQAAETTPAEPGAEETQAAPAYVPTKCIPYSGLGIARWPFLERRGFVKKTNNAGEVFVCPPDVEPPAGTETGEPGTGLGEFQFPQELQDLYNMLISRGQEYLGEPGYSDQAMAYAFGNDFEKLRQQEAAKRQQLSELQASQGMLGTGSAAGQMMDLAWGTENNIAQLMRDIFLQNEAQKRSDVELGQRLFGTGVDFQKLIETLNAARRGEGAVSLQQLLTLLQILKGGA